MISSGRSSSISWGEPSPYEPAEPGSPSSAPQLAAIQDSVVRGEPEAAEGGTGVDLGVRVAGVGLPVGGRRRWRRWRRRRSTRRGGPARKAAWPTPACPALGRAAPRPRASQAAMRPAWSAGVVVQQRVRHGRAGRATSRPRARTDRPSAREGSTSPTGRPAPGSSRSATAARCAATVPSGRRAAGRAARGSSARRARRGSGRRCFRCPRPAPRAGSRGPEPTVRRMEVGGGQQEHRLLGGTDETVRRARPLFRRRQGLEQAVVEHQALQAVQGDLGPAFLDVA